MRHPFFTIVFVFAAWGVLASYGLVAQVDDGDRKSIPHSPAAQKKTPSNDKSPAQSPTTATRSSADAAKLVKLNKQGTVLLDPVGKRVLLKTKVCLTDGVLEMLVCQAGTKEHESILSIDAKSYVVHAGLLALGAKSGRPVQFVPEFSPPTGQEIDVIVTWKDKQGKLQRRPVNEWIRYSIYRYFEFTLKQLPDGFELPDDDDLRYDEVNQYLLWFGPMTAARRDKLLALSKDKQYQAAIRYFYRSGQPRQMNARFVFAGSSFYLDEDTGKRQYRGEGGYLICVANFPSATIDIAIESSAEGDTQMFEAWTKRLPPVGTEVTVELIPRGLNRALHGTPQPGKRPIPPKSKSSSKASAK